MHRFPREWQAQPCAELISAGQTTYFALCVHATLYAFWCLCSTCAQFHNANMIHAVLQHLYHLQCANDSVHAATYPAHFCLIWHYKCSHSNHSTLRKSWHDPAPHILLWLWHLHWLWLQHHVRTLHTFHFALQLQTWYMLTSLTLCWACQCQSNHLFHALCAQITLYVLQHIWCTSTWSGAMNTVPPI